MFQRYRVRGHRADKLLWLNACLANALSVSATIFDTLCDVDAKFVKLADKECDAVSAEVKKWFKKLAVSVRYAHS